VTERIGRTVSHGCDAYANVNGDPNPSCVTFIDANILIDVGRGSADALAWLRQIEERGDAGISIVVQMELLAGCCGRAEMRPSIVSSVGT
jgi:hypothetical protein